MFLPLLSSNETQKMTQLIDCKNANHKVESRVSNIFNFYSPLFKISILVVIFSKIWTQTSDTLRKCSELILWSKYRKQTIRKNIKNMKVNLPWKHWWRWEWVQNISRCTKSQAEIDASLVWRFATWERTKREKTHRCYTSVPHDVTTALVL